MNTAVTLISLIPEFLRVVSSAIGSNTTLGAAMDGILATAASLIEVGDNAAVELQALTEQIKSMVASGRDPTDDEWSQLQNRSDTAHARIQAGIQGSGAPVSA